MKKFFISMVALFAIAITVNAQTAIETQKLFDNVYVGIEGGVSTPLSFKNMFPVNAIGGLKVGKEFTPVVGAEVEGLVFFNDNKFQRWTDTFVKGTNVSFTGTINLMNLFGGYKGTPRTFEIKTNTGLGWLYLWNTSQNSLSAKSGVDVNFNLGKTKAHTLFISPVVYWNLCNDGKIQFNKNYGQFAVLAGYVYHFKTSNGTRHFKTYDVGAMNAEIKSLNEEKAALNNKVNDLMKTNAYLKANPVEKAVKEVEYVEGTHIVNFALNSYELDGVAKEELDKVKGSVNIYGYASPDGKEAYNKELSQKRADTVAKYLKARGVEVKKCVGNGAIGAASNRIVIVSNK